MNSTTQRQRNISSKRPEQPMPYMTIRNVALNTGISEYALRRMQKAGQLPGFYSGTRYIVDTVALQDSIRNSNNRL